MVDTVRTDAANLSALADNTTGNITPQNVRDAYVSLSNFAAPIAIDIPIPEARTYTIDLSANEAYTINNAIAKTLAGTCTVAVQINGSSVTGLSAIAVTTTRATSTATASNTVAAAGTVTIVVSSISGADGLALKINRTRT